MIAIEESGRNLKANHDMPSELTTIVTMPRTSDRDLTAPLRDAAVAGVVLNFNPRDSEMRERASDAWDAIRSSLARHLLEEGPIPFPGDRVFSRTMSSQLKKRYFELRALARQINSISFEDAGRDEIAVAGKALCTLAVRLDDLIGQTEHEMLSKLRQHVFAPGIEPVLCEQSAV